MRLQETLDFMLGRRDTSHSSPKSVAREIGRTKGEKLTREQCERLTIAVAFALSEIRRSEEHE
jgi:hypothetical protein